MKPSVSARAVAAAIATASGLGLRVDDAVVLHDSSRIAVRLLPCGVLARVADHEHPASRSAAFEVEVGRRLAEADGPIAGLDPRVEPRVYERDGFVVTLWTYYEPVPRAITPSEYADAFARLHAAVRGVDLPAPHFTDRVADAQRLVADRALTPELAGADRTFLADALRDLTRVIVGRGRGAAEQVLHGEPHPGNLLRTQSGLRFIDLETCCRGPIEFDIAHAPETVDEHCPAANRDLVRACRILVLAMVTTWRWDRDDQFPDGPRVGTEGLDRLRAALA